MLGGAAAFGLAAYLSAHDGGARKVASSAWQLRDYSLPAPAAPAVAAGAPSPAALK